MKSVDNSSPLMRAVGSKESFIKRINEKYQPKIDDVKSRHESAGEQAIALQTLGSLTRNYTKAAGALQDPVRNPFDKKMATVTTTDTGKPGKYVSVVANAQAVKGSHDVKVERIAKASTLRLTETINYDPTQDGGGHAFDTQVGENPLTWAGRLVFAINGAAPLTVSVSLTDTGDDVIRKINYKFSDANVKVQASLLKVAGAGGGGGTAHILLNHQEMGSNELQSNFDYDYTDLFGVFVPVDNNAATTSTMQVTTGNTAIIHVDGVQLEQASNVFDGNIQGVTITALAANTVDVLGTPVNQQKVNIVPDSNQETSVIQEIDNFAKAYNALRVFVAKMTEKTSSTDYADTAVLHNSSEIRQASYLLDSVFTNGSVVGGGKYNSLADIGIGLVPARKIDEAPSGTEVLDVVDNTKFLNALTNNYDDFTALFRGNLKTITHSPRGSTLNLSYMTDLIDRDLLNRPMTVSLQPGGTPGDVIQPMIPKLDENGVAVVDALGAPVMVGSKGVTVNFPAITDPVLLDPLTGLLKVISPAVTILGTYKRNGADTYGYISFEGTPLEGLRLQWDAVNVTMGAPETFIVKLTQGLSDVAHFRSSALMSTDGNNGTILLASKQMQNKVKRLSVEQTKMEDTIKKELDKIEQQFARIEQMSSLNDIFMDAISDILNPAN